MTRVLLAAGPSLLVVDKDGVLYFRDRRRGDRKVPYAPENYQIFLDSARFKHDMSRVVGLNGESDPEFSDDEWPELQPVTCPGEGTVFRLLPRASELPTGQLTHVS